MKNLLVLFLLLSSAVTAQNIEMRSYNWKGNPACNTLTADEQSLPLVIISDEKVIEYIYDKNNDLAQYSFRHRIIHINQKESVDKYNKIYIPVTNPEQLMFFEARSVAPDGTVKEMGKADMKKVTDDGQLYMSVAIDGVVVGSDVEYYTLMSDNVRYARSENIQDDDYIRQCRMMIITPENLFIKAKVYNAAVANTDSTSAKKNYVVFNFSKVKALEDEKYVSGRSIRVRVEYKLAKNTLKGDGELFTFADGGKRYYEILSASDKSDEKTIRKVAEKLDLKDKNDTEKARIIETYLKSNFNIKEESPVSTITDAVNKNIADVSLLNRLGYLLSKAAGLKTEIVITINRFTKKFDPDFQSWNFLDDIFFYYPAINKYMMPGNLLFRLGDPPYQYQGEHALFIKEIALGDVTSAVTSIRELPVSLANASVHDMNIAINFEKDFTSVSETITESLGGFTSTEVRPYYFYGDEDRRKELAENLLKNSIEGAKLTNMKVLNYDINSADVEKPFIVSGTLTYTSLIEKAGNGFFFKVGDVIGPQEQLYQEKARQNAIALPFVHYLNRKIVINTPAGYTAKGLDKLRKNIVDSDTAHPGMGFTSNYKNENGKIEITITEYYDALNLPITKYEEFRNVINASSDFNKVSILFEKTL